MDVLVVICVLIVSVATLFALISTLK